MLIQTLKGFRDFLPMEAKKRQYVINTLKSVFELYGFEPLETPALEYDEILAGKYGEEGEKLMYRFEDKGKRKVAMRYDQTVPLARVTAQYQNVLPMPFKRYQIQNVWRADNTQKGRYREFLQCDADIVGISSPLADAEILGLVYECYKRLGLDVIIKINDRKLLKNISLSALPTLDKLNKIGEQGVIKELQTKGFSLSESENLLKQAKALKKSEELQEITDLYKKLGYPEDSLEFDGTLIRGLDYYTGLIFEVVLKSDSVSLCGGGRFDNLVGMFANKQIPAVGFAMGFDRMVEAMETLNLFPKDLQNSITKVLVTIFNESMLDKSLEITSLLRNNGINTEIYPDQKVKMDKQLKYADRKNIPYAVIIGIEEVPKNSVILKNLKTRSQKTVPIENLIDVLK